MAHALQVPVVLGAGNTGLSLAAALANPDGTPAAGLVTTSLTEVPGSGTYLWAGTVPDGFRGFLQFATAGGLFKAAAGINPPESENADIRTSSLASTGQGANSVTLTVQDSFGNALIGAQVTVKNAAQTAVVAGPVLTDLLGRAVVNLAGGVYQVLIQTVPFYAPLPAQALAVSGTGAALYTVTPLPPGAAPVTIVPAARSLRILTWTDYDAVRQALDISLDAATLPDAVIEALPYGPAAESEVLAQDPLALTYETTDASRWARVTTAALLLTAARIAPALPQLAAESLGDYRVALKPPDLLQRSATLRGMALRELAAYLNSDGNPLPLPAVFVVTGRRGR